MWEEVVVAYLKVCWPSAAGTVEEDSIHLG
jgi:hypothetical protein